MSRQQGEDGHFSGTYLTMLVHKPVPRDRRPGTLLSAEPQSPPENNSERPSSAPAMNHTLYLSLSTLTACFGSSDKIPEAKRANSKQFLSTFVFFPLYRSERASQHKLSRLPAWPWMLGSAPREAPMALLSPAMKRFGSDSHSRSYSSRTH